PRMRKPRTAVCLLVAGAIAGCGDNEVPDEGESIAISASTLPGSYVEIDTSANLVGDGPDPAIDWVSVTESRRNDLATGQNDNSYAGGAKESDTCPGVGTGSIPNNKSDLKT